VIPAERKFSRVAVQVLVGQFMECTVMPAFKQREERFASVRRHERMSPLGVLRTYSFCLRIERRWPPEIRGQSDFHGRSPRGYGTAAPLAAADTALRSARKLILDEPQFYE
jgi:hypothetical protein